MEISGIASHLLGNYLTSRMIKHHKKRKETNPDKIWGKEITSKEESYRFVALNR